MGPGPSLQRVRELQPGDPEQSRLWDTAAVTLPFSPSPHVPLALHWVAGELKAPGMRQPELQTESNLIMKTENKNHAAASGAPASGTRPGRRGPCRAGPVRAGHGLGEAYKFWGGSGGPPRQPRAAPEWPCGLGRALTRPPPLTGGMPRLLLHVLTLSHRFERCLGDGTESAL